MSGASTADARDPHARVLPARLPARRAWLRDPSLVGLITSGGAQDDSFRYHCPPVTLGVHVNCPPVLAGVYGGRCPQNTAGVCCWRSSGPIALKSPGNVAVDPFHPPAKFGECGLSGGGENQNTRSLRAEGRPRRLSPKSADRGQNAATGLSFGRSRRNFVPSKPSGLSSNVPSLVRVASVARK